MPSKLKERFERLGRVRDVSPGNTGSPVVVSLRLDDGQLNLKPIDAIRIFVGTGLTLLKAKRLVEALQSKGEIEARLPAVSDIAKTLEHLARAGVCTTVYITAPVDIKALREKLSLTQEQFALRFNLPLNTVQHWEQGRELDQAANNYLRVISEDPRAAIRSQLQRSIPVVEDPSVVEKSQKRWEWVRHVQKVTKGTFDQYVKLSCDETASLVEIRRSFFAWKEDVLEQMRLASRNEETIERWREIYEAEWWHQELMLRHNRGFPSLRDEKAPKRRA